MCIIDLNNDGYVDIAVANRKSQNYIYYNNTKGFFSDKKPFGPHDEATIKIASSDFNQDGFNDLVLANRNGQKNRIYYGPDFQKFSFLGNDKHETRGVAIHDMNSDGFNDIITVNIGAKNNIFFGDRNGSFGNPKSFGKSNDATMALAIGDLDNDGDLDIIAANNGQKNQYYINDGKINRSFKLVQDATV